MPCDVPIACTLSPDALRDRTAWIGSLNRNWLRRVEREPRGVTLVYDADAEADLRELVRLEAGCCAFLTFELIPAPSDEMRLRIAAPSVEGAEYMIAPFLSGVPEGER